MCRPTQNTTTATTTTCRCGCFQTPHPSMESKSFDYLLQTPGSPHPSRRVIQADGCSDLMVPATAPARLRSLLLHGWTLDLNHHHGRHCGLLDLPNFEGCAPTNRGEVDDAASVMVMEHLQIPAIPPPLTAATKTTPAVLLAHSPTTTSATNGGFFLRPRPHNDSNNYDDYDDEDHDDGRMWRRMMTQPLSEPSTSTNTMSWPSSSSSSEQHQQQRQ